MGDTKYQLLAALQDVLFLSSTTWFCKYDLKRLKRQNPRNAM